MLHVKFENHGCSDFREKVILMDLNARVDANFARVDVNFQTANVNYLYSYFFSF